MQIDESIDPGKASKAAVSWIQDSFQLPQFPGHKFRGQVLQNQHVSMDLECSHRDDVGIRDSRWQEVRRYTVFFDAEFLEVRALRQELKDRVRADVLEQEFSTKGERMCRRALLGLRSQPKVSASAKLVRERNNFELLRQIADDRQKGRDVQGGVFRVGL